MAKLCDIVYLDSCVILDYLTGAADFCDYVEPIIRQAESDKLAIVASVLCITEVLAVKKDANENDLKTIEALFSQEYVNLYDVDEPIAKKGADIRINHRLKTIDAIHVATAIMKNATVFITRDGDGKKRNGTILAASKKLKTEIEILTPKEFFNYLSDEVRQSEIPTDAYGHVGSQIDSTE